MYNAYDSYSDLSDFFINLLIVIPKCVTFEGLPIISKNDPDFHV